MISYRKLTYFLLLLLAPEVATANVILPTLTVSLPIMWLMLIVVVAVETMVLIELWPTVPRKIILKFTAIGNLMSTLVGIPAAYYMHYIGISLPMARIAVEWQQKMMMSLPILGAWSVKMLVNAPKIINPYNAVEAYVRFLFLLPLAYYISYRMEYFFFNIPEMGKEQILAGVRRANRMSYMVVLLFVTSCLTIILNNECSSLALVWNRILNVTSRLGVLLP